MSDRVLTAYQRRVRSWIWPLTGIFGAMYMLTTIVTLITIPQATANFAKYPLVWGVVVLNVLALQANKGRSIIDTTTLPSGQNVPAQRPTSVPTTPGAPTTTPFGTLPAPSAPAPAPAPAPQAPSVPPSR